MYRLKDKWRTSFLCHTLSGRICHELIGYYSIFPRYFCAGHMYKLRVLMRRSDLYVFSLYYYYYFFMFSCESCKKKNL